MPRLKVCVGVPVFNGERYLRAALESVLAQQYGDIEVHISDNSSTDATEEISRGFVSMDSRVRYFRHGRNIGGARNQNSILERTSAPLFKWVYSDDVCAPDLISTNVESLLRIEGAVTAYSGVQVIDSSDEYLFAYGDTDLGLDDPRPSVRLSRCLRSDAMAVQFGVHRTLVLRELGGVSVTIGGEMVLPAGLALRGPLVRAPGRSLSVRQHESRYGGRRLSEAMWVNPNHKRSAFPYSRSSIEIARTIRNSPISGAERRRSYAVVLRDWTLPKWRYFAGDVRHLATDLALTASRT